MADKKVPAAPNLSGIQDAETRRVLQQIIDGMNVRNGQTRDQGAQFVSRDELEKFLGKGNWSDTFAAGQGYGSSRDGAMVPGGIATAFRALVGRIIADIKTSKLWGDLTARIDPLEATARSAKLLGQQSFNVATALDGTINGSWTVKFDADGYVCGAGLGLEGKDGAYTSEFLVLADRFAVAKPGSDTIFPFVIDTVGGNPVIAMNGQVYINALTLDQVAENAANPAMNYIGEYATAPDTTELKKNSIYKNTTTGHTYVLLADAGSWGLYVEKGAPGPVGAAYWIANGNPAVQKSVAGVYTPASVSYSLFSAEGTNAPAAYAGRFVIATSTDGATYTTVYTSSADESVKTYTVPAGIKTIRCRGYLAGGTATLIDEAISTIVSDGATGADSVVGLLSNDAHNVPADANGNVTSFAGATTTMSVFKGVTDDSANWTYSAAKTNATCSEAATSRTQTVTALSADVGYVDITASRSGYTSITKRFTVSKTKQGNTGSTGSTGSAGPRGSMTFYTSGSSWSDTTANNVVTNITGSSTKIIGDTVTISNGSTFAATKYWSGSSWVSPGVVINGNLLVTGTVSAAAVGAGTFTGQTFQTASSGKRIVLSSADNTLVAYNSSGSAYATIGGFSGAVVGTSYLIPGIYGITSNSGVPAVYGSSSSTAPAVEGMAAADGIGVRGVSSSGVAVKGESTTGDAGVVGQGSTSAHGVRGKNVAQSTSGLVGVANGYNFYADGAGADYGTFTGAHDALVLSTALIPIGSIVVDECVVAREGWSNAITSVVESSEPVQKGVLGVLVGYSSFEDFTPNALFHEAETYYQIKDNFEYAMVNSLGEGLINVCGEAGDFETGDLIVTSSTPGVGMKQADDIVRSYTVAKIREVVTFTSSTEVKQVACIYLCG